jgi:hypothetical protein
MSRIKNFSLRTMLIIVCILCMLFSTLTSNYHNYREELSAALFLKEHCNSYIECRNVEYNGEDSMPSWDYINYNPIVKVVLYNAVIDEKVIQHLTSCKHLQSLVFEKCIFGGCFIKSDTLHEMSSLELNKSPVSTRQLAEFCVAPKLRSIVIRNSELTDDHLKALALKRDLITLGLDGNSMLSSDGFSSLGGLNIESLSLNGINIEYNAIGKLLDVKGLKALSLSRTGVDDKSMEILSQIHSLEFLKVDHTNVTVNGMMHLLKMPKLEKCWFAGINITTAEEELLLKHFSRKRVVCQK